MNHMYQQGIIGVNFVIAFLVRTLDISPIPNKIQLGPLLTQGLGAGSNPEIGMQATEESVERNSPIVEQKHQDGLLQPVWVEEQEQVERL